MDAYFQKSCLSFFAHHGLYFFLCFFYHFLNSGRVNSAVHDQTFQSDSCHFSSDRFKSGKYDCLRRIINNKLYACQCLEGTDITSFTSDNTSLDFIRFNMEYSYRVFNSRWGAAPRKLLSLPHDRQHSAEWPLQHNLWPSCQLPPWLLLPNP